MMRRWTWRHLASAFVIALGCWALYRFGDYLLGGSTRRFHVEAAATIFVVCGLALRLSAWRRTNQAALAVARSRTPLWTWPLYVGAGLVLYGPALSVGFLSDDFVLLARASTWSIGQITSGLFRPVPLAVWAALVAAHAPAFAWHVLNVGLHGTNAYLSARLAERWMPGRALSLLAGALMLTAPLAPEAVVWASGLFDVSATTLILVAVLLSRSYEQSPRIAQRAGFILIGVVAIGAKETAVVASVLVLIDAWVRGAINRKLLADLAVVFGAASLFSVVRLLGAFGLETPPASKYLLQRVIFESFGGLIVPWHASVVQPAPWLVIASAGLVVALLLYFFTRRDPARPRFALGAPAWVLVSVLPVAPILFVAPDLQGARYLYLAGPAWAGLLAGLVAGAPRSFASALGVIALASLIVFSAIGVRHHLEPWRAAASVRDRVARAAASHEGMGRCGTVALTGLPDNINGAYVFRNGGAEALETASGLRVSANADPACSFQWDTDRQTFVVRVLDAKPF